MGMLKYPRYLKQEKVRRDKDGPVKLAGSDVSVNRPEKYLKGYGSFERSKLFNAKIIELFG